MALSGGAPLGWGLWLTLFGSYTFYRQRSGGRQADQVDADQNQVRIGLQIGYPISLDCSPETRTGPSATRKRVRRRGVK